MDNMPKMEELLVAIERGCNDDVRHLVSEVRTRIENAKTRGQQAETKVAHLAEGIGRIILTNVRTMKGIFANNDEAFIDELERIFTENEKTVKRTLEAIGVVFPK